MNNNESDQAGQLGDSRLDLKNSTLDNIMLTTPVVKPEAIENYSAQVEESPNIPIMADILLDKIDRAYADEWEYWWRIMAAYRNSGGSLERFIEWSHTDKYDVPKQVERAWYNCQLNAGLWTLVYYVKESGYPDIIQELRKQHYEQQMPPRKLTPPSPKPVVDVAKTLQMLIEPRAGLDVDKLEHELQERSTPKPQGIYGSGDLLTVLDMYEDDEIITFPQNTYDIGENSRDTVSNWRSRLHSGEQPMEFFIPNTHCGEKRPRQDGELSWRADACFKRRFSIIEFDEMPLADQMRLWISLIDAGVCPSILTFSGSKSVHALIPAPTDAEVETIFNIFLPLGADPHTRNVGRMSRTPGAFRMDKGNVQKLLYMNLEVIK